MIHPNKDKWITGEVVTQFQDNMKAADKSLEVYHFDADHAFANPSSPRYNEEHAVQV
ncbi:MAG: dienelactone hydrolase family protein [Saprospiraceae bacterium]